MFKGPVIPLLCSESTCRTSQTPMTTSAYTPCILNFLKRAAKLLTS